MYSDKQHILFKLTTIEQSLSIHCYQTRPRKCYFIYNKYRKWLRLPISIISPSSYLLDFFYRLPLKEWSTVICLCKPYYCIQLLVSVCTAKCCWLTSRCHATLQSWSVKSHDWYILRFQEFQKTLEWYHMSRHLA